MGEEESKIPTKSLSRRVSCQPVFGPPVLNAVKEPLAERGQRRAGRLMLREVNNFNELGHDTVIGSSNTDFAVISMYSDNPFIFCSATNATPLRVEKKSISKRNALNS